MNTNIYRELKKVAKSQGIIYYSDVANLVGLDMGNIGDNNRLAAIIGEISEYEHSQGRPMLSAVVIRKDSNMPGKGFFALAKALGIYDGHDEVNFHTEELKKVHAIWLNSSI